MNFMRRIFDRGEEEIPPNLLSGNWEGWYSQHGLKHRLAATLSEQNAIIGGSMVDLDRIIERSLYEEVAIAGLPPGSDETIAADLYPHFPNEQIGPISVITVLPEMSNISGTVNGHRVTFKKSYESPALFHYRMGNSQISRSVEPEPIEYHGQISADRRTIIGRWTIYLFDQPKQFIDGDFELRKVAQ